MFVSLLILLPRAKSLRCTCETIKKLLTVFCFWCVLVSELFLTSLFSGQGYVAPEFGFKMTMIIIIIIKSSLYIYHKMLGACFKFLIGISTVCISCLEETVGRYSQVWIIQPPLLTSFPSPQDRVLSGWSRRAKNRYLTFTSRTEARSRSDGYFLVGAKYNTPIQSMPPPKMSQYM